MKQLPLLFSLCLASALPMKGAWTDGPLGWVEDSADPYLYSLGHGWIYTPDGIAGEGSFWWYGFSYGLGWLNCEQTAAGWNYSALLDDWVYPGGLDYPGWWFNSGEWHQTPVESVYFVATDGSDAGVGTSLDPFATITKAISLADANDVILVRGGTYREQLLPGTSGEPHFPITLQAYAPNGVSEDVIVSAYEPLVAGENGLPQWTDEGDNIYSIQLTSAYGTVANRLLVRLDGETGIDARWPNADSSFDFFRRDRASADSVTLVEENGLEKIVRYNNAGLAGYDNGAWSGARMFYLPGKGWSDGTASILDSGNGHVEFKYTEVTFGSNWNAASEGDVFYLMGRKVAIDQPGEFFHDVGGRDGPNGMLYVKFPDGKTPANTAVEVKRQSFGFRASGRSHWRVRDIHFDGGAVASLATCSDIHFDGISVEGVYAMGQTTYSGAVSLEGEDVSLRNSMIYQSSAAGVSIESPGVIVENNVIGWTADAGISTRGAARDLLIRNNTVFMSSGQNISITAKGSRYLSNRAYLAGMTVTDIASMNAWGSGDMDGMEIAWNMVHDNVAVEDRNRPKTWNGGMGIRFDSGGGAGVSNGIVHHNLVWNTTWDGINMWGLEPGQANYGNAMIDVYNNSVGGILAVAGSGVNVTGVSLSNNYSDDYIPRYSNTTTEINFQDNFTREETSFGNEFGDPRFFNVAGFDFRPLPDSALVVEPFQGAIGPDEVFPVAGAIWNDPEPALLTTRFIETFSDRTAIGVAGMPQGLHLPDGTLLRLDGNVVTADLLHRYDIETHLAEAVFLIDYIDSSEPVTVEISFDGGSSFSALNPVLIEGGLNLQELVAPVNLSWSGRINTAPDDAGGLLSNLRKTDAGNPNLQVGDNALNAELALVLVFDMSGMAGSLDAIHSWTLKLDATGKGLSPNPFPGAVDVRVSTATAAIADSADLYGRINSDSLLLAGTLPAGFDINGSYAIDLAAIAGQTGLSPAAPWLVVLLRAADPTGANFSNAIVEQTFFGVAAARMDLEVVVP